MKPKFLNLLEFCIENGSKLGVARAYKHNDDPTQDQIAEKVSDAVMEEIYQWFDIDEDLPSVTYREF